MDILPPVSYSTVCHKSSAVALTFTAIQCPTCCLGTYCGAWNNLTAWEALLTKPVLNSELAYVKPI